MVLTVGLWSAAIVLLLLAVPIHVHVAVERDSSVQARVLVSWLFGLVRFRVHPDAGSGRPTRKEGGRARGRRRRRGRIAARVAGNLLRPDFRGRSVVFLRDVLRALRPRDLHVRARIGMDDPADTGRLWGCLGPLGLWLASRDVRLEPVFDKACLRFRAAARVRVIPAQLLALTLAFLFSPPIVRALVAR